MEEQKEEKLYKGFSPLFTTILVILMYIAMFISRLNEVAIGKGLMWFIPYIYFFLLVELLGRVSPRFRLNPAQLLMLLIPLTYAAGKAYIFNGGIGETWFDAAIQWGFMSFTVGVQASPSSPDYIPALRTLPDYFIPKDDAQIMAVWNGLEAAQAIDWSVWLGPLITWSLVYISMNLLNLSIGFLLTGPQWTTVERLVFPLSIPSIYAIQQLTERDEKGRGSLFSGKNKVLWAFFVIGLILGGLPLAAEAFPPLSFWGAFYWGEFPLHPLLRDNLNPMLPGADFGAVFIVMQAALMILLPYDVNITSLVTFVIVQLIYAPLAVRAGLLAYQEGGTYWLYGQRLPWPYQNFAINGLSIGFALYLCWTMRDRFKTLIDGLRGKDEYIGDLSARSGAILGIISVLLFLGVWIAVGVPVIIAIIFLVIYFLYQVASARYMNEIWWHQPIIMHWQWQLYYPVGAALGYWSWNAPQVNQALMASNTAMTALGGWGGPRQTIYATASTTLVYQMAHRLKASIKQILIWCIIIVVIGWPVALILQLYMDYHLGAANLAWAGGFSGIPGNAMSMGITELSNGIYPGFDWGLNYGLVAAGIVLIWILMFLKTRFAWFGWFNPSAFILTMWLPEYMWLAALVALILKVIISRAVGPRRSVLYVTPAASGLAIGFGSVYIIAGLYYLFTLAIPTLQLFWS